MSDAEVGIGLPFKTSPMELIPTLMTVSINGRNLINMVLQQVLQSFIHMQLLSIAWDTGEMVLVRELKKVQLKG